MKQPQPLSPTPTPEVPLPRAPLARVIAQVRFPPILTIGNADKVAVLQELLRETYPHLNDEQVHQIEVTSGQAPKVTQDRIWRLADRRSLPKWRVSLGVGFVSLETSDYESRQDFLQRLSAVIAAVGNTFRPAEATRLGLRYIDRLTGGGAERIRDLVRPDILGIAHRTEDHPSGLRDSIVHLMTELQLLAQGGRIKARWGELPSNATYDPDVLEPVSERSWILDLDMFTSAPKPFAVQELHATATGFAEVLYWLFRQMVTEEFLQFYGGTP